VREPSPVSTVGLLASAFARLGCSSCTRGLASYRMRLYSFFGNPDDRQRDRVTNFLHLLTFFGAELITRDHNNVLNYGNATFT